MFGKIAEVVLINVKRHMKLCTSIGMKGIMETSQLHSPSFPSDTR